jgi:hypothetical protein
MVFDVTPDEANLIGAALGKQPYEVVAMLIAKLTQQASVQQDKQAELANMVG